MSEPKHETRTRVSRRTIIKAGIGAYAALSLGRRAHAQSPTRLNFSFWGQQPEQDGFNRLIEKYQAKNPNVAIKAEIIPPGPTYYQQLDTRLAGGQGPDLFRAQYQRIGKYAENRAAVDLSPYLDKDFGAGFAPTFWAAASFQGKVFAMPHHTDTFALYYNIDHFEKAGLEAPKSIDKSWTWDDFIKAAKQLKAKQTAAYPFAMHWVLSNAYRWLPFLYQHGGSMLDADFKSPAINSKAGIETIAWTQSWFKDGLVPANTSIKGTEQTQNLFANGTISMLLNGNWQIPFLNEQMTRFRWGVTYMPRDVAMASDLGGNCVAVSKDSKHPEVAADFLKFIATEENMREFVIAGQFLPVRKSLMDEAIQFKIKPELMPVFVQQARTIPEHMARTEVLPKWSEINVKLNDELDLAFTSGQSPEATAKNLEAAVKQILAA
jgi:multiple sugar transport system substrate-binding protein